jgi:hypothetical protein
MAEPSRWGALFLGVLSVVAAPSSFPSHLEAADEIPRRVITHSRPARGHRRWRDSPVARRLRRCIVERGVVERRPAGAGGDRRLQGPETLEIATEKAGELHLHGYDEEAPVESAWRHGDLQVHGHARRAVPDRAARRGDGEGEIGLLTVREP